MLLTMSGAFAVHRSDIMNGLLEKFNEYKDISNYRIRIHWRTERRLTLS